MEMILLHLLIIIGVLFIFTPFLDIAISSDSSQPDVLKQKARNERSQVDEAYSYLLNQVLGDRAKADRLIAYERCTNPGLNNVDYIKAASQRIIDENNRWN